MLAELKVAKIQKLRDIDEAQYQLEQVKIHVNEVCNLIKTGIDRPALAIGPTEKFLEKRIEF